MQRSHIDTLGERTATAGGSVSHSGSSSEDSNPETSPNGTKKRKRSLAISYVVRKPEHLQVLFGQDGQVLIDAPNSCELCKKRKVKCDKVEPQCSWCARHGRICEYKMKRKPGLRAGYGRELETKINQLESFIQALGSRVDTYLLKQHDSDQGLEPPRPAYQSPDLTRYSGTPHSATAEIGFRDTPNSTSGWPHGNASAGMHYSQPLDTMPARSMVDITVSEILEPPERSKSSDSNPAFAAPPALSSRPDASLPPYDLLHTLVDLYFKHINTWSPILDRKVLFDTFFGPLLPKEPDLVLLHAIVAATLRFSNDPRLTSDIRVQYHSMSKQKVQTYGLENSNIRALQALTVLSLDVLGTSNGPQGWNLIAMTARSIVQLGLHVERGVSMTPAAHPSITPSQVFVLPAPTSWVEDEERRRLCWMIFVLDRYATVATRAFDFTFNDEEMDRQLPCRYDLFSQNRPVETRWLRPPDRPSINRPENLGSFSYHCEILQILSHIHRFLRRPIDIGSLADVAQWQKSYRQLDGELNTWLYSLPDDYGKISQLCHSDPSSKISNWIMLHAAFHTSVIRLHCSAAYPTVQSHIFKPSYTAMQKCLAAVEGLRGIAQDVVSAGMADLLGPPFAFSLWVSVRLLLVHGSITDRNIDPNIGIFLSTLEQMGQYWEIARSYCRILSSVIQQHQQAKHSIGMASSGNWSAVGTFAAMRSTAYKLNLLLSQKPNSVVDAASIWNPASMELEYLDVFDFFNYPRLPTALRILLPVSDSATAVGNPTSVTGVLSTEFAMPNAETDWLVFRPPHD